MPELKKVSEVLDLDKMIGLEKPFVFDLDQIKNAQLSIGKVVQSMTIPIGEIQALRALVAPSASVLDSIKEVKAFVVSVDDTHKAFVNAFAPAKGVSEMIGKIFKQHAEEFQRVADIGNIIREQWVKTIEETNTQTNWQQASEQLRLEAATHVPALRQEYEAIVDDLPLALTFTVPKVTPTYKTKPAPTRLSEEDKEDIVARLANKVVEVMIEKYDAIQLTRNEFTSGVIVETHEIRTDQLTWGSITLDFKWATLQYKEFQAIDISPGTQAIQWLACIMEKQGELATNIEFALATGLITPLQAKTKTNREVARIVQLVKKQVVALLLDAGMKSEEIKKMIKSKRNIGFIMRHIDTAKLPQK